MDEGEIVTLANAHSLIVATCGTPAVAARESSPGNICPFPGACSPFWPNILAPIPQKFNTDNPRTKEMIRRIRAEVKFGAKRRCGPASMQSIADDLTIIPSQLPVQA